MGGLKARAVSEESDLASMAGAAITAREERGGHGWRRDKGCDGGLVGTTVVVVVAGVAWAI